MTTRVKSIFGLGYRFVKELNHPMLILKIFDVNAAPILEYCSFIWNRDRVVVSKRLEQIHHSATRIALGTPYRTDAQGYKPFPTRLRELNKIDSQLAIFLRSFLIRNVRHIRNPNLFDVSDRRIAIHSRLRSAMLLYNTHRNVISINESVSTIKNKMNASTSSR